MTPKRPPAEQHRHDLAVRRVCRARFAPDAEWESFTNPGESRRYALVLPDQTRLFPDIVVRRRDEEAAACVVEVETESTVTDLEARQWQAYAALDKRFYLYVPAGCLLRARELCQQRKVPVAGYAVYELTPFWIHIREFRV